MSELQQPGGISMEQSTHSALQGADGASLKTLFSRLTQYIVDFMCSALWQKIWNTHIP